MKIITTPMAASTSEIVELVTFNPSPFTLEVRKDRATLFLLGNVVAERNLSETSDVARVIATVYRSALLVVAFSEPTAVQTLYRHIARSLELVPENLRSIKENVQAILALTESAISATVKMELQAEYESGYESAIDVTLHPSGVLSSPTGTPFQMNYLSEVYGFTVQDNKTTISGLVSAKLLRIADVIKQTGVLRNDHKSGCEYKAEDIKMYGVAYHPDFGLCLVAVTHEVQSLNRIEVRQGYAYITTWDVGGTLRADYHGGDIEAALLQMTGREHSNLIGYFPA